MRLYLYVRYILCCVTLLFFHIQMSVCYAADVLPKPIIKVGILSDGFFPFQTLLKGRATGYSVELIELLAVKIDYNIVWRVYKDRESIYDALCKGDIDVQLDAFNYGAMKCSSYSWPYSVSPTVVVIRQDSRLFRNVRDANGAVVAIEKDSSIEKSLSMHYENINKKYYDNSSEAMKAVSNRKADLYIGNFYVAKAYIENESGSKLTVASQLPLLMENLHFGINSKRARLLVKLDTALQSLSIEEKAILESRWLDSGVDEKFLGYSSFFLQRNERAWLASLPMMRVSLPPHSKPLLITDKDGGYSGLINDYVKLMKSRLGLGVDILPVKNHLELIEDLLQQDADVSVLPVRVLDRIQGWQASQPFISFPISIITKRDNNNFATIDDLNNSEVVTLLTDGTLLLELKSRLPSANLKLLSNLKECLDYIASGKGDVYLGNVALVTPLLTEKYSNVLSIKAATPFKDEFVFAVRDLYAPLLPLINRFISHMSDREREKIKNTWLSVHYTDGVSWQSFFQRIIPAILLLLLFMFVMTLYYMRLRKEIKFRINMEAELEDAKNRAEAAVKQKSDFLATMTHEIRTPMNGIIGLVEQLSFTELNHEQKQMIEMLNIGASGLHQLLNNVLDYSKLSAGKVQLENNNLSVVALIDSIFTLTAYDYKQKGLSIYLSVDDGVSPYLFGDELRLRQIIFNFFSNSVKFTSYGFVELSIKLMEDRVDEQSLVFTIKDSGIGISNDKKERIFDAFEQADSSITRHYGGSGLGLSICSFLAKHMGGSISIESAVGVGTEISLNITLRKGFTSQQCPNGSMRAKISIKDSKVRMTLTSYFNLLGIILCDDSAKNIDLHFGDEHATEDCNVIITKYGHLGFTTSNGKFFIDSSSITGYVIYNICSIINGHKMTGLSKLPVETGDFKVQRACILVVEDNKLNQIVIERQLKQIGVRYDLAKNGQEALEMLSFKKYDLVLCDCHMPILDGYEFTQKMRLTPVGKTLPIIAMTANVLEEQVERCLIAGMNDILCKPVKIEDLISVIKKWYDATSQPKRLLNPSTVKVALDNDSVNNVVDLFCSDLQESLMVECHSATDFANLLHRQAGTLAILKLDALAHDAWVLEESIRANGMTAYEKKEFEKFQIYIVQVIEELVYIK